MNGSTECLAVLCSWLGLWKVIYCHGTNPALPLQDFFFCHIGFAAEVNLQSRWFSGRTCCWLLCWDWLLQNISHPDLSLSCISKESVMDFVHEQPFGAKKIKNSIAVEKCGYFNPVVRYSDGFDAQKGFYAPTQQSQRCFLLYFRICVVSPCYQMSKPKLFFWSFPFVKKLVIKLEAGVLFVSWIRLQRRH